MSVHLSARSYYSLMEGMMDINTLVTRSKELGFSAVCLSDRQAMYGAAAFMKCCRKNQIKGIIGLEDGFEWQDEQLNFVALAKDSKGYLELIRLCGISDRGELDINALAQLEHCFIIIFGEGGCLEAELINEDRQTLRMKLQELKDTIGSFDMALSYQETSFWRQKNAFLKDICKELEIRTVALNKVYYLEENDSRYFKALRCIRETRLFNDQRIIEVKGRHLLSPARMAELYEEDDLARTEEIAAACNCDMDLDKTSLPKFQTQPGITSEYYLRQLCKAGLLKRFNQMQPPAVYIERLEYELNIITNMHYEDYFLIVYDFIRHARRQGIYVGPGRGSAAGSLCAYCLGITHIDPIRYNLLFERFLNPERISMPDIDTDFPDDRRDEVIQYMVDKYGVDHVAHIITFNTFGAKQSLRDAARILNILPREIDMLTRQIPAVDKMSLSQIYQKQSRFAQMINADKRFSEMFEIALKIEGLPRHTSQHAAGIVMSRKPLDEVLPTMSLSEDCLTTQYSMEHLEELGLIKMDFLGLRNLSTIDSIVRQIREQDPSFDIMRIPLNDAKTFELIKNVDTLGIFQLESEGMKQLIKQMQPSSFEEVSAAIALYRPGSMNNIPLYIRAKSDPSQIQLPHPKLAGILKETYGVMIYQEQIMQAAQILAGFSLGRADVLRKAMSKKDPQLMQQMRSEFVGGCLHNGIDKEAADKVFDNIEQFAGYGFNKAHSIAYGLIVYQLAYLKANYPLYFYTELLNSVNGSSIKSAQYIEECKHRNIPLAGLSVNHSDGHYKIEDGSIRFPLSIVKGMGKVNVEALIDERKQGPFADYFDFVARAVLRKIPLPCIESMIDAGALDEFGSNRRSMRATLEEAVSFAQLVQIERNGQMAIDLSLVSKPVMVIAHEDRLERSEREKEALGFCIGAHPIVEVRNMAGIKTLPLAVIGKRPGMCEGFCCVVKVHQHRTKKGDLMAFVTGLDESGQLDLVLMPNVYSRYGQLISKGKYIRFNGKIDKEDSCLVNSLQVVEV